MRESLYLGTLGKTRIGLNWSVLVVAGLLAVVLAESELPAAVPGWPGAVYWATALAMAVLFFAALLAHELAHAFVARRRGVGVGGIVLWALGGVAKLESDAPDPGSELRIALAGPGTSALVAVTAGAAAFGADRLGASALAVVALAWLAEMNALIAVFNLLPAYPLDGGRVLRAGLWRFSGDRLRATERSARVGTVIGGAIVALGLFGWLVAPLWAVNGIWLALVGWFVIGASRHEARAVRALAGLEGRVVGEAMLPAPVPAPAYATLSDLVEGRMRPEGLVLCPLVELSGAAFGVVAAEQVTAVPYSQWPYVRAAEVAWPLAALAVVGPGDALSAAASRLAAVPSRTAVVLAGDALVGLLRLEDVERLAHSGRVSPAPGAGMLAA